MPSVGGGSSSSVGATTSGESQQSQLGVEVVDYFFPATGPEFSTGAQFQATMSALQGSLIDSCMSASGFVLPSSADRSSELGQYFDNDQFPNLAEISQTGLLDPSLLAPLPSTPSYSGSEQQAFSADLARCIDKAAAPFTSAIASVSEFRQQWISIITQIESSPAVQKQLYGFSSCVQRSGVPEADSGSFQLFLSWVTGLEAGAGTQAIAVDRHWAPTFVRCARSTVSLQESLQTSRRAQFLQENFAQVHALQAEMNQIVAQLEQQESAG